MLVVQEVKQHTRPQGVANQRHIALKRGVPSFEQLPHSIHLRGYLRDDSLEEHNSEKGNSHSKN